MLDKSYLKSIIDNLQNVKILVIGDFALDEMIYGASSRISREAPVLILKHTKTDPLLGAASNAAHNISTLNNGQAAALGLVGKDYYGNVLAETLKKANVDITSLVVDETRVTTTKTRISGSSAQSVTQQIVRIDRETNAPISENIEQIIIEKIKNLIPKFDGVLLSDYGIGIMTPNIIKTAISTAKQHSKVIAVDAQQNLTRFQGATIITPNQPDAEKTLGYFIKDKETLIKGGQDLLKMTNSEKVLITRGSEGMVLFENNGSITSIPAFNKTDVFDVTGAGDTVVASVTLGLCAGANPVAAATLGNLAASLVVRKFGAATTTREELIATLDEVNLDSLTKIKENICTN